jgi:hypothetical protein
MFKIDYSKASEPNGDIKDGVYEVFFDDPKISWTQTGGVEHLDLRMRIRKDFTQEHQNQLIFHRAFKSKETGKYHEGMLMNLAKQARIPDGTEFSSIEHLLELLDGKALKVTVKNESSTYQGKEYNNLVVKKIEQSMLNPMAGNIPSGMIGISDDDLPF